MARRGCDPCDVRGRPWVLRQSENLGFRLALVFPEQPQPEAKNVCHPTAYMRWTIKNDLELSLKLLGQIAIDGGAQKQKGS